MIIAFVTSQELLGAALQPPSASAANDDNKTSWRDTSQDFNRKKRGTPKESLARQWKCVAREEVGREDERGEGHVSTRGR